MATILNVNYEVDQKKKILINYYRFLSNYGTNQANLSNFALQDTSDTIQCYMPNIYVPEFCSTPLHNDQLNLIRYVF